MHENKPKPELDIVNYILEECILAYPISSFIIGLYKQYLQRGSLSKKQLSGLYGRAVAIQHLPPGKLATLEALIKKMPTRFKSEMPPNKALYEKNEETGKMIEEILSKFPQHKRALFLKSKFNNNEVLSPTELSELRKFKSLIK
ncbi:MAG TPA: hypothetical protein VGO09_02900 [Flavisolibacter sp.]|jgi:hypothetical protein|nr:hypothetical protein [Flavisolibacter sp.]